MSDDLGNRLSFLGNPGESVAEVDPDDLKTFWQETRKLQAKFPGQDISFSPKAIAKTGANAPAVWYRSSMILVLNRVAQEQLSPWIKDEEVLDAVFRTMATIPMEWIGHAEREGLPFDVEEFFRRLRKAGLQNG
jgi:hypothetical protein